MSPKLYNAPLNSDNEVEQLEKLIYIFSAYKHLKEGGNCKLRPKLVSLLALYFKFGLERDAKKKAAKILGTSIQSINSMNLELRSGGYLIKDKMNQRRNHLYPHLESLKDYFMNLDGKPALFMFNLQLS